MPFLINYFDHKYIFIMLIFGFILIMFYIIKIMNPTTELNKWMPYVNFGPNQ